MPKFVFLWTDLVLWLLVAAAIGYAVHVRRTPSLRVTWRYVARSAPAMAAAVVLAGFIVVALLDSVHFRPRLAAAGEGGAAYATRTLSLLDLALSHARLAQEKTYSPPLAYWSLQKETAVVDGREVREHPRLQHGGAHLEDPSTQWRADLALRSLAGAGGGLLAAVVLALAVARLRRGDGSTGAALRQMLAGSTELPWRTVIGTAGCMLVLAGWIGALWPVYHVFGTDRTGNDVLYQALKSIRTAVVIGALSSVATLPLAVALGVLAGYFKGWVDDLIQYLYTVLSSIPPILLVAAFVLLINVYLDQHADRFPTGVERAELRLLLLCLILGITGWATLCRLLRAETLKLSELEYVQAARAFGVSHWRIMGRHILPNVMHLVLIVTVLDFSGLVLYEAVLSYVGVGVDPNSYSFGSMINLARSEMSREPAVWWNLATAFGFMLALVLAANLFADALREAFDPRARALRPRWRFGAAHQAAR
jgi:peptide/nickel transport system permease protein